MRYVVRGSGPFPLDMLRFDHSWPARPADSAEMEPHKKYPREITLESAGRSGMAEANSKSKWSSLRWTVLEVIE